MPNTREKLIELLAKYFDIGDSYAYNLTRDKRAFMCGTMGFDDFVEFDDETVADIANHLIANGVTVQEPKVVEIDQFNKWISVKDRLPEDNSNVMACLWIEEEGRVYPAFYAHGVWWDRVFSTPTTNTTTHWQPMPQPPKGE